MSSPKVSILMVTYNSSLFIEQAIKSVLTNKYPNYELIISDDCSTDGTWQKINEFNGPNIFKYQNKINLGEYKNRNEVLKKATGKYCVYVDGDDFLLRDGLFNAVKNMEEFNECKVGIVRPENPKYIAPIQMNPDLTLRFEFFSGGILDSALCNNIYLTEFLKSNPFLTQYKNGDSYSRIMFSDNSPILILYHAISIWRRSNNQASERIKMDEKFLEKKNFFNNYLSHISNLSPNEKKYINARLDLEILKFTVRNILNPRAYRLITKINFYNLFVSKKIIFPEGDKYSYYNLNVLE
jgi:glycosyltransferase involved in cell wall biosynthesis